MTQQIYTTPTPFTGKDVTIENTGRGYTSNMVIKGQTYQNLVTENNGIDVFKASNLKPNTKYTIIVTKEGGQSQLNLVGNHSSHSCLINQNAPNGTYKAVRQTDNQDTEFYLANVTPNSERVKLSSFIVLEGDWTNKEVPSSITGIESVGEKENNKISILSHNKNLIKLEDNSQTINGITYTFKSDGRIIVNGTATNLSEVTIYSFNSYDFENKTLSISGCPSGGGANSYRLGVVSDGPAWVNCNDFGNGNSCLVTSDKSLKWDVRITIYSGQTVNNMVFKPQLELSSSPTSYEPYKEDKKEILIDLDGGLKSLPDGTCDTIEQREDGVYLVQRIEKLIFNGSESEWKVNTNEEDYIRFAIKPSLPCKQNPLGIISDKFPSNSDRRDRETVFMYTNDGILFCVSKSRLNDASLSGFKEWLQANPTTVYYELATSIETKLDINNINLQTFKDLTYVTSDNSIEPVLEFKAPILGYKTINPIQLKTTQDGTEVNVYPYSTPELITFGDNETLADKMNNIENTHKHNNATVTTDGFMSKESYSKLESLTNYTHPSTHAATMITEDSTHRFITDTERNNWNAKASTNIATPSTNGLMSNTDKQKLDRISNNFDIVYDANTETIRFRFR